MADCINLKEMFGKEYFVRLSEPATRYDDPWYHVIPCKYGHIYPHGGEYLGFSSKRRGKIPGIVAQVKTASMHQDGDDGCNVIFHFHVFGKVAQIVRPRRRPRISAKRRAELREMAQRNLAAKAG